MWLLFLLCVLLFFCAVRLDKPGNSPVVRFGGLACAGLAFCIFVSMLFYLVFSV